jgi:hypothetical protein
MSKASDLMLVGSVTAGFFTSIVLSLLGFAIHIWTVILVAQFGMGFSFIVMALFTPVFPEIALGYVFWVTDGLFHPYCLALLSYVGLSVASLLGVLLLSKLEGDL